MLCSKQACTPIDLVTLIVFIFLPLFSIAGDGEQKEQIQDVEDQDVS